MTCLAYCCECFHVNNEDLNALANEPENVKDGHFIRDMLIEVSHTEATTKHNFVFGLTGWLPDDGEHYFTCKHWDSKTRLCKVYDSRPQMCRDHPQGICKHGCGLSG